MISLCENIVDRIQVTSFDSINIARMVLFFKHDKNNRLFFLYASSIRLEDGKKQSSLKNIQIKDKKKKHVPLAVEGSNFIKPFDIKLTHSTNPNKPVRLGLDLECLNCEDKIQEEDLVDVPYGFIINYNKEIIKIKHEEV